MWVFMVCLFCVASLLTGCGAGPLDHTGVNALQIAGSVHGGQQPVSGATVQLYTVGSSGNGSAATAMLTNPVMSDGSGRFTLTGDYVCGESQNGTAISGGKQVYVVASGGNPGLASGTNNTSLVMVAALGSCGNLSAATNIEINEVTTMAAAWALAPFAASAKNIGASATNTGGIANAFLDSALLADTTTGMAATVASNLSVETGKLYALANVLATCVNSDGTAACGPLFAAATPPGGSPPADTFTAALNIVKNPGYKVSQIFGLVLPLSPFATTLTQSPNDWTMSLTVSGGGLQYPTALGVDAENNVWVVGSSGPLSGFGPQGTPLSATGFGAGDLEYAYGLAIDTVGDIWVTNYNAPYRGAGAVTKFLGSSSGTPGAVVLNNGNPGFYDSTLEYPYAVSADTNGDIFVASNDGSSASVYDSNGNLVSGGLGANSGIHAFPDALAVDASHGFWLSDSDTTISHFSSNGTLLSHPSCCSESYGLAVDAAGNVWVADIFGGANGQGAFAEVKSDGTVLIQQSAVGGIYYPAMVAVDAAQNVWFTNFDGNSITEIAGAGQPTLTGTAISPSVGVYGTTQSAMGGYGLDAGLASPFFIAPDRSGNVWVSNEGKAAVTMFFGLATPTATPVQPSPVAP